MGRVAVIGGGAAGMMAAVTAAENGAEVFLYEKNDRLGKKILATGNGKCNFSNRDFSVDYYNGNGRKGVDCHKMERLFGQFSMEDTINFFQAAGMLVKEKNGYLYPRSEQASTVLDILRLELRRLKVEIKAPAEIKGIEEIWGINGDGNGDGESKRKQGKEEDAGNGGKAGLHRENGRKFRLLPFESDGCYDAVVVACGGCAAAKTGSDGSGYKLAGQLGHRIVPVVPALVQLRCSDGFFKTVAGVRCEAKMVLYAGEGNVQESGGSIGNGRNRKKRTASDQDGSKRGTWIQEETGELQFTDYGISGIPVFQLSRQAAYLLAEKKAVAVSIDFFPHMGMQEFEEMCAKRLSCKTGRSIEEFLIGMENKKINVLMMKLAGLKPEQRAEAVGKKELKKLLFSYRELQVHVSAANSFEQAQVTAGGVDMAEMTDQLSSVKVPGAYFAGEILDVDGRCGGYNLQWAWTSGYIAGKYAALGTVHK